MKISAFETRIGELLVLRDKLWRILKKNHVKPGKGGAFVQLEMKCISDGTKLNERFRSEDRLEKAYVDTRPAQYLYRDGEGFVFMNLDNYEQQVLPETLIEEQADLLLPDTEVQISVYDNQPIGLTLPASVVLKVAETQAAVKGQTAASGGKPAVLETGRKVTVPVFVEAGEMVRVNTETGEYIERA